MKLVEAHKLSHENSTGKLELQGLSGFGETIFLRILESQLSVFGALCLSISVVSLPYNGFEKAQTLFKSLARF